MDASELLELKRKELEEKKRRRAEMRTKIEEQRKALAERAEAEKVAAEKAGAEVAGDDVAQGVADELEDILGSLLEFAGPVAGDDVAEGGAQPLDSARSAVTEDDVDDEDDASASVSASGSRVSETPEQEGFEKEESEVCQWLDDVLLSDLGADANGAEDLFDADEDVSLEALQAMHSASHSSPALPVQEAVSPSVDSSLPPIVVSTADDRLRLDSSSEPALSREAKKGGNVKKKKSKKVKSDEHSAEAPAEGRAARTKTAEPTPKRRSTTVSIRNFISQAVTKDKKQSEDKDAEDMKLSDGTAFEWKKKAEAEGVVDVQNLSDVDKIRFEALRFKRENERKTLNAEYFAAFAEAKKTSRRLCVIEEIVSSEREYVEDLTMLIDFFLVPLRAAQLPVNLALIFGNVELLLAIHQDMLASLDSRVREAAAKLTAAEGAEGVEGAESVVPSIAVADVFLPMADNLLSYDQYCMNHRKGVDALVAAENSRPAFAQKISQCRFELHKVGVQHHLKDFLIKPVQRICKYPLLFRELLGETETDHPDYVALQSVLEKLDDVARRINEQKASADNRDRLNTIEKKVDGFPGKLDGDGRHLVHEGMMDKMNPRGKVQRRQYFLFNDLLIWCKPNPIRRGQYAYKGYIKLDRCVVREPTDNQGYRCMFEIIKLETKKVYQLIPLSAGEKKVWMAKIEKIVDSFLEQMASPRKSGGGSKKPTGENSEAEGVPPVKIPPLGSSSTPKRRGTSRIMSADVDRLTARVDSLEKELAASNALNEELLKRLSAVEERLSMLDGGEVCAKRSPSSSAAPNCEEAKSNPSDHIDDDYDEEYESE